MLLFLALIETEEEKTKFELLFNEYHEIMYRAAYGILRDQHKAEDAVSHSLLKIIDHLDKIGDVKSGKTKAFLITVVEHTAIDHYRKFKREKTVPMEEWTATSEFSDYYTHSGEGALSEEDDIIRAINSLPIQYAVALRLKYSQGYSDEEIGKLLNLKKDNVRQRIKRAKDKLSTILTEMGVDF